MTTHYPALTVLALFESTGGVARVLDPTGGRRAGVRAWAIARSGAVTAAPGAC